MKQFQKLEYIHLDGKQLQESIDSFTLQLQNANKEEAFWEAISQYNKLYSNINSNTMLALIHSYLDGSDEYYLSEMAYAQGLEATLDSSKFYESVQNSPFRASFEKKYGTYFLHKMEKEATLTTAALEELQREQQLIADYQKLLSTARFSFRGETHTNTTIEPFRTNPDSKIRTEARYAHRKGLAQLSPQIEPILSELVALRHKIATDNGFANYLEYKNTEYGRFDYGEAELTSFCEFVKSELVPLQNTLNKRLQERLHLDHFTSNDTGVYFLEGNPKPIGNQKTILTSLQKMMDDLGPDFSDLCQKMIQNGYIDNAPADNKLTGIAFTTQIFSEKTPFIFDNYTGDYNSANNLIHELGHAIQMYLSMQTYDLAEINDMPLDLSEIPSKTMEHFGCIFAEHFFGQQADQYREIHTMNVLQEICGYCLTHEFETFLYTHIEATPQERIDKYLELSDIYMPVTNAEDPEGFLKKGVTLYHNLGIFMFARYLISYVLDDVTALYLIRIYHKEPVRGLALYKKICSLGSSMGYAEALESLGIQKAYTKEAMESVKEYLIETLQIKE